MAKFIPRLSIEYTIAKTQLITGSEMPTLTEAYNRLSWFQISFSYHSSAMAANGGCGRGPTQWWRRWLRLLKLVLFCPKFPVNLLSDRKLCGDL